MANLASVWRTPAPRKPPERAYNTPSGSSMSTLKLRILCTVDKLVHDAPASSGWSASLHSMLATASAKNRGYI